MSSMLAAQDAAAAIDADRASTRGRDPGPGRRGQARPSARAAPRVPARRVRDAHPAVATAVHPRRPARHPRPPPGPPLSAAPARASACAMLASWMPGWSRSWRCSSAARPRSSASTVAGRSSTIAALAPDPAGDPVAAVRSLRERADRLDAEVGRPGARPRRVRRFAHAGHPRGGRRPAHRRREPGRRHAPRTRPADPRRTDRHRGLPRHPGRGDRARRSRVRLGHRRVRSGRRRRAAARGSRPPCPVGRPVARPRGRLRAAPPPADPDRVHRQPVARAAHPADHGQPPGRDADPRGRGGGRRRPAPDARPDRQDRGRDRSSRPDGQRAARPVAHRERRARSAPWRSSTSARSRPNRPSGCACSPIGRASPCGSMSASRCPRCAAMRPGSARSSSTCSTTR